MTKAGKSGMHSRCCIRWSICFINLAEFEREMIRERTLAGMASARARGRKGGRPHKMTTAKLRLAMASLGKLET
jgi:hypothetical protein